MERSGAGRPDSAGPVNGAADGVRVGPSSSGEAGASPFHSPVPELMRVLEEKSAASTEATEAGEGARGQGVAAHLTQAPSPSPSDGQGQAPALGGKPPPAGSPPQRAASAMPAQRTTSCLLNQVLNSCARAGCLTAGAGSAPAPVSFIAAPLQPCTPPVHGVRAVCGKRAKMEDTFSVQMNFVDLQLPQLDPADAANKLPARIFSQVGQQLLACCGTPPSPQPTSLALSPSSAASMGTMVGGGATHAPSLASSDNDASLVACSADSAGSLCNDTLHFFGVYDGHGGVEAAQHCANRLHHHLSSALSQVAAGLAMGLGPECTAETASASTSTAPSGPLLPCHAEWPDATRASGEAQAQQQPAGAGTPAQPAQHAVPGTGGTVTPLLDSSGTDCDTSSHGSGSIDSASAVSRGSDASLAMMTALEDALRSAFLKTDEEFAEDNAAAMVGSTAVVALVGTRKMWIANCGDSRAVLCRAGKAYQVTDDHKPEREDEAERVEKAGGQVLYWNGHRVMGVLAMSRAIGDHGLRPYIIPEPEITVLQRVPDDDFLLLASDGLWDVMSNQEAITLAARCLARSSERGATREAAVRVAATVLTRAAVDRGSKDNVTVVIIDLSGGAQAGSGNGGAGGAQPANGVVAAVGCPEKAAARQPCAEPSALLPQDRMRCGSTGSPLRPRSAQRRLVSQDTVVERRRG